MNQNFVVPKGLERRSSLGERIAMVIGNLAADKAWMVTIAEVKRVRTDPQNRYLWGVCYPTILSKGSMDGWEAADLHEYFLGEHFGWELVEIFGKKRQRPIRRSSKLTTLEFMDFVSFIQRTMASHGVFIEDPDPMKAA